MSSSRLTDKVLYRHARRWGDLKFAAQRADTYLVSKLRRRARWPQQPFGPKYSDSSVVVRFRCATRQGGFVLVWVMLMLTLLFGLAGLSVDIGNWYLQIQRTQRAADAAALDGVPYLPGNLSNAQSVATASLISNGVNKAIAQSAGSSTDCSNDKDCMRQVPGFPNELEVQIHVSVPTMFLQLLGVSNSFTFVRDAYSTFRNPVAMGNVSNVLGGSEPVSGAPGWPNQWQAPSLAAGNANYFLSIEGANTDKNEGDRYATQTCVGVDPVVSDYCSGGLNSEYTPSGYNYHVQVDPGGSDHYLRIEAYDPAYIATGSDCSAAGGPGPACAGDETVADDWASGFPATTFTVTTGGATPTTVNCNGGMNGTPFPGYDDLTGAPPAVAPWSSWFHQWVPICDAVAIDPTVATDLTINVKSSSGDGMNSFMLRAGVMSSPNPATMDQNWTYYHTRVNASDRLEVFNNYDASAPTNFHMVRVPPSWAGQKLSWQFFDVGDGTGPGWLNMVGSPDVDTASMLNSSTCQYTPPGSLSTWLPTLTGAGGGCEILINPPESFDGRVVNMSWQVPSSYTCDDSSPTGCWLMVEMNIPGGAVDHTTWTLTSQGSPIRLVKPPSG